MADEDGLLLSAFAVLAEACVTPDVADALDTVGAAGLARLPQSQLVTLLAVLCFSAGCLDGVSLACAAIKVARALELLPANAG